MSVSHNTSNPYAAILAKTRSKETGKCLPLYMHHMDTAGVAALLVERWLSRSAVRATGLTREKLKKITVFTAMIHDIGKATAFFQGLLTKDDETYRTTLIGLGFRINDTYNGKTNHAWAGHDIPLSNEYISRYIAAISGAHHGHPYESSSMSNISLISAYEENFYGISYSEDNKHAWSSVWLNIIADAYEVSGVGREDVMNLKLSCEAQNIIAGLVTGADWLTSNEAWFPYINMGEGFTPEQWEERINHGWACAGLSEQVTPCSFTMDDETFRLHFGFNPNPVQKTMMRVINRAKKAGLYMLDAPMGIGKTEAALAAAEILCARLGCNGAFLGLPTQATASGLFPRFSFWADSMAEDSRFHGSIKLAHGSASLNETYVRYMAASAKTCSDEAGLTVNPWFDGSHRSLLPDFVIGTVDQMLTMSLKRKYYTLKHLGLANKVIIIDECHAYDAFMGQYLEESLRWCGAYGIPVIMMSATLPKAKRKEFIDIYRTAYLKYNGEVKEEKRKAPEWAPINGYPLLTWTEDGEVYQEEIKLDTPERKVRAITGCTDITGTLSKELANGGCAAVIVNTVKKAQEVCHELEAAMPDKKIIHYHAHFTSSGRATKEHLIIEELGKHSEMRNGTILVGTQVLEQSLDYDVDVMLTQLCPIDLLLQRIGRLHRHSSHDANRPENLKTSKCYVMEADRGSQYVYGKYLLTKTESAIPDEITLPRDIPVLVEDVYGKMDPMIDGYKEYVSKILSQKEHAKIHCLSRKSATLLASGTIDNLLKSADDDMDDAHAEASVRDGVPAAEAILIKISDGYAEIYDDENFRLSLGAVPTKEEALVLLKETIKLPSIPAGYGESSARAQIEDMDRKASSIIPKWRDCPWLQDKSFLIVDESGTAEVCGKAYTYDTMYGLAEA